jgi:hypothetical protein
LVEEKKGKSEGFGLVGRDDVRRRTEENHKKPA